MSWIGRIVLEVWFRFSDEGLRGVFQDHAFFVLSSPCSRRICTLAPEAYSVVLAGRISNLPEAENRYHGFNLLSRQVSTHTSQDHCYARSRKGYFPSSRPIVLWHHAPLQNSLEEEADRFSPVPD